MTLGPIGQLQTTSGDFKGFLTANNLAPTGTSDCYLKITGDLDADVLFKNSVSRISGTTTNPLPTIRVDGSFNTGRLLVIGDELEGPSGGYIGGIEIGDTTGLGGQVIINANATTSGLWSGDISVGASTLDPSIATAYTTPSTSVGGRAVGLVPYRLYASDCSPPQDPGGGWNTTPGTNPLLNSQFSHQTGVTPRGTTMSFYGPIDSDASTPASVWVWLRDQYWMDVTDYCDITLSGRTIEIHGDGSHVLSAGTTPCLRQLQRPARTGSIALAPWRRIRQASPRTAWTLEEIQLFSTTSSSSPTATRTRSTTGMSNPCRPAAARRASPTATTDRARASPMVV